MDIPLEVWREISLFLPLNFLSISKSLIKIYDESWFQEKVLLQYPNCKKHDKNSVLFSLETTEVVSNNSWEYLYKRSLKSGIIYHIINNKVFDKLLVMKGMKICESLEGMINYRMILTFDGDLIYYNENTEETRLIDSNVKDITDGAYIKNNELYMLWYHRQPKLIVRSESPFLAIADNSDIFIGAITNDTFYYYSLHSENYSSYECEGCIDLVYSEAFLIQKIDGTIMRYEDDYDVLEKVLIPPIKYLYSGCAKLLDGTLLSMCYDFKDNPDISLILTTDIIDVKNNNLRGSVTHFDYQHLLIDKDLYKLNLKEGKIIDIKLIEHDVKNICYSYVIK
jgi:hypothetical protein